jgi:hypothetical protein
MAKFIVKDTAEVELIIANIVIDHAGKHAGGALTGWKNNRPYQGWEGLTFVSCAYDQDEEDLILVIKKCLEDGAEEYPIQLYHRPRNMVEIHISDVEYPQWVEELKKLQG